MSDSYSNEVPIVLTPYGPVTEWARKQAALNLRDDPTKYAEAVEMLTEKLGSVDAAVAELKRYYPEAFI